MYLGDFGGCCSIRTLSRLSGYGDIPEPDGMYVKYFVAVFVEGQQYAYEHLKKHRQIVWQSPPFMGAHGKQLFMVLYKAKK